VRDSRCPASIDSRITTPNLASHSPTLKTSTTETTMPLRTISSKTSLKSYGSVDTTFFDSWEFGTDPESLNGSLINHPSVKRFENYRRITLQMILCLTFAVILFGVVVSDPLSMNIDATNLCEKVLVLMASASFIETN
jgi:hypothetical protein